MRILQISGSILVISALAFVSFASDSALADKAAGKAVNIVETNNVIQVYTYTGVSSEITFLSTFDEGEFWTEALTKVTRNTHSKLPTKQKSETRYSRSNRTRVLPVQSEYIKAIDSCVDSGKQWDFRTDDCREPLY